MALPSIFKKSLLKGSYLPMDGNTQAPMTMMTQITEMMTDEGIGEASSESSTVQSLIYQISYSSFSYINVDVDELVHVPTIVQ